MAVFYSSVTSFVDLEDTVKIAFIDELKCILCEPFESWNDNFDGTWTSEIVELISEQIFWKLKINVLCCSLFDQDLIMSIVEI